MSIFKDYITPSGGQTFESETRTILADNKTGYETLDAEITAARDSEVDLKTRIDNITGGGEKVKVTNIDATEGYLQEKLVAKGDGSITITEENDKLKISAVTEGDGAAALLPPPIISGPILVVEQQSIELTIENYDNTATYNVSCVKGGITPIRINNKITFTMPNIETDTNFGIRVNISKTGFTTTYCIHNILSLSVNISLEADDSIIYSGMQFYKYIEFGSYLALSNDSYFHASAEPQDAGENPFYSAQVVCDIENKEGMIVTDLGGGSYKITSEENLLKNGDKVLIHDTNDDTVVSTTLTSCTASSNAKPSDTATITPNRIKGRGIDFLLNENAFWTKDHEGKYIIHKNKGKAVIANANEFTDTVNEIFAGTIYIYEGPDYIRCTNMIPVRTKLAKLGYYIKETGGAGLAQITGRYSGNVNRGFAVTYITPFDVGDGGSLAQGNYEFIASACTCNIIEEFDNTSAIDPNDWYLGPIEHEVTWDGSFTSPDLAFINNNIITVCENEERETSLPIEEIPLSNIKHSSAANNKIYCGTKENINIFQGHSKIIAYVNGTRKILDYTNATERVEYPTAKLKIWKENSAIPAINLFANNVNEIIGAHFLGETNTYSASSFTFSMDYVGAFIFETNGTGIAQITSYNDANGDPYTWGEEQCRMTIFEEFTDSNLEFEQGAWGIKWYEIDISTQGSVPIASALVPYSYEINLQSATTTNITGYLPADSLLSNGDTVTVTVDGVEQDVTISNLTKVERDYDDKTMLLLRSDTSNTADAFDNLADNAYTIYEKGVDTAHSTNTGSINHSIDNTTKFGQSSFYFPGGSNKETWAVIKTHGSTYWNFNDDDFTIDFWYKSDYFSSSKEILIIKGGSYSHSLLKITHTTGMFKFEYYISGTGVYTYYSPSSYYPAYSTMPKQEWFHIAVVKKLNECVFYINGTRVQHENRLTPYSSYKKQNVIARTPYAYWLWTQEDTDTSNGNYNTQSCIIIGHDMTFASTMTVNGFYMQELRVSKTARWHTEFIPPQHFYKHYYYSFDIPAQITAPTKCKIDPYQGTKSAQKHNISIQSATLTTQEEEEGIKIVYYTGNGTTQSITGVGFQPDIIITRNNTGSNLFKHVPKITDVINGTGKCYPFSNTSNLITDSELITSFDIDGFTVGNNENVNENTSEFFAMCFNAKSNGGYTTYDSERYSKRFGISLIKYTGNGTQGQIINHSLEQKPTFIWITCISTNKQQQLWNLKANVNPLSYSTTDTNTISYQKYNSTTELESIKEEYISFNQNVFNNSGQTYMMLLFADIPEYQMTFTHITPYYPTSNSNNEMPYAATQDKQDGCIETGLDMPTYIWGCDVGIFLYDKNKDLIPRTEANYTRTMNYIYTNKNSSTANSGFYWTARGVEAYYTTQFNNMYPAHGIAWRNTAKKRYKLAATSEEVSLSNAKTISTGMTLNKNEKVDNFQLNLTKEV